MSGAEDEWVKIAMTDDTVVAELLVRLRSAAPPPPLKRPSLPLEWSVRQRRSKPVFANTNAKKQPQSQRASPTTPLSWSGATSASGGSGGAGAGGSEESSRLHIQKVTRSKVNEDSEKNPSKRSRKKKTLAQLKDEESSLLKERRDLKRKLVTIEMNLEKQRATNENLKRMKIESQPLLDRERTPLTEEPISDKLKSQSELHSSSSYGCPEPNADAAFELPDLNIPFEENPVPGVTCGVS
ncbi:hypothetical protein ACS0TY_021234 [Phlomoides rotata]